MSFSSHRTVLQTVSRPRREGGVLRLLPYAGLTLGAVAVTFLLGPFLMGTSLGQRSLLAISLFALLFSLCLHHPDAGVLSVVTYLALLGGLRRWLIPPLGWAVNDPLVLVVPVLVTLYFSILLINRLVRSDTRLSRLLIWLLGLMALQMLNPLQGGMAIGLAGALFYIVPVLWFYVGRHLGSARLLRWALCLALGISLTGALYGLYQTAVGFSEGEVMWLSLVHYNALSVDGVTRPFSFFTSAGEYTTFLGIGIVLLWAAFLRGVRPALLLVPLLATAMLVASSRGIVVTTLAACAACWAVQGPSLRSWAPRGLVALILAAVGLTWTLRQVEQVALDPRAQALVAHQTAGLLNPLDPKQSTTQIHVGMATTGLLGTLRNPLGHGLGSTTMAVRKFGGYGGSTEIDLVNMFASLGALGGLLYAVVIAAVAGSAIQYWRRTRTFAALGAFGLLALTFGQWLNGGYYATSTLLWFCLGALDRENSATRKAQGTTRDARLSG
jgi:hypothetical protein